MTFSGLTFSSFIVEASYLGAKVKANDNFNIKRGVVIGGHPCGTNDDCNSWGSTLCNPAARCFPRCVKGYCACTGYCAGANA